jgi:hypothetical protein
MNGRDGPSIYILAGRPLEKRTAEGPRRKWKDMIERDVKDIGMRMWVGLIVQLERGGGAPVDMAINLRVPLKQGNLLTN